MENKNLINQNEANDKEITWEEGYRALEKFELSLWQTVRIIWAFILLFIQLISFLAIFIGFALACEKLYSIRSNS